MIQAINQTTAPQSTGLAENIKMVAKSAMFAVAFVVTAVVSPILGLLASIIFLSKAAYHSALSKYHSQASKAEGNEQRISELSIKHLEMMQFSLLCAGASAIFAVPLIGPLLVGYGIDRLNRTE